jgi:hypothetical protein
MLEINCSNINAYGEGLEDYSMFCQGIGVLVLYTNSCWSTCTRVSPPRFVQGPSALYELVLCHSRMVNRSSHVQTLTWVTHKPFG